MLVVMVVVVVAVVVLLFVVAVRPINVGKVMSIDGLVNNTRSAYTKRNTRYDGTSVFVCVCVSWRVTFLTAAVVIL